MAEIRTRPDGSGYVMLRDGTFLLFDPPPELLIEPYVRRRPEGEPAGVEVDREEQISWMRESFAWPE